MAQAEEVQCVTPASVLTGQARWAVECADAREALRGLPDGCIDAVVTDPPYALTQLSRGGSPRQNDVTKPYGRHRLADKGFMGQQWDTGQVAHDPAFWAEVLRVARPGAFLLAFGGPRTYHRLACAVEDAGWECRDMLNWMFGSGFPKSKSCLKPAHEPILLAKAPGPLQPLQIDACRIQSPVLDGERRTSKPGGGRGGMFMPDGDMPAGERHNALGRWPSNLVLSHVGGPDGCRPAGVRRVKGSWPDPGQPTPRKIGTSTDVHGHRSTVGYADAAGYEQVEAWACVDGCPVKALDEQAGPRTSGARRGDIPHKNGAFQTGFAVGPGCAASTGNASRFFPTFHEAPEPEDAVPFFYCAKASRRDRNQGCEGLPAQAVDRYGECGQGSTPQQTPRVTRHEGNSHSTVKPTTLMAWLCRLITPLDGVVLDCFSGSGSTGVACMREGFRFIGIDQDEHYCAIARARIAHAEHKISGPLFAAVGSGVP